jgi:hypothetical protein
MAKLQMLPVDEVGVHERLEPPARDAAVWVVWKDEPLDLLAVEDVVPREDAQNLDIAIGDHSRTSGKKERVPRGPENPGLLGNQDPEVGRSAGQPLGKSQRIHLR